MIDADNTEFMELMTDLFGAHSRNVKADILGGYSKGLRHMTLGEFRAVVTECIDRLQHAPGGEARPPTVAEIWQIHRDLKRQASTSTSSSSSEPKYSGDHWSVAGNSLLLLHITRATKPPELDYAPDSPNPTYPGQHTVAIAKILAKWKNVWVVDAREAEADGFEMDRKAAWAECMQKADAEVREYLARYVRRAEAA